MAIWSKLFVFKNIALFLTSNCVADAHVPFRQRETEAERERQREGKKIFFDTFIETALLAKVNLWLFCGQDLGIKRF